MFFCDSVCKCLGDKNTKMQFCTNEVRLVINSSVGMGMIRIVDAFKIERFCALFNTDNDDSDS